MATPLYTTLRDALGGVAASSWKARAAQLKKHKGSGALPPLEPEPLRAAVNDAWAATGDGASGEPSSSSSSSSAKRAEVIKTTLEMVARDLAVRPLMDGELAEPDADAPDAERASFLTALQDRLDLVLTLFEVVSASNPAPTLETGHLFVPLLEEYPELLLASTWHAFFHYVETRAPRFTKDMPVAKGKQLSLLRLINSFLRVLSHTPGDLELRGRVQLFASRAINIADKSAINLRGEYSRIVTTWEEPEAKEEEGVAEQADGDVEMADADAAAAKKEASATPTQPDFYSTLWSLQQYFAYPPSLDGPPVGEPAQTPFETFRTKSDFVLQRLFEQTRRERVLMGKNPERAAAARKRPHADLEKSYPRYLTSRSLLEYEVADQSFRRQILVQYFILFQFLLNLTKESATKQNSTGGMPKSFVLDGDNFDWVAQTARTIRQELKRMDPGGPDLDRTIAELMQRERRYATWKNEGCDEGEWDITPADPAEARRAAASWKRHCGPARRWMYKLGTPALSRLWENRYEGMGDFLGDPVRTETVFTLEERLAEVKAEEEDERAMGREPRPDLAEQKRTINWLALRQARRSHPREVAAANPYDLHKLVASIREREAARAAKLAGGGQAEPEGDADAEGDGDGDGDGEAAEAEGDGEADGDAEPDAEAEAPEEPQAEGEGEGDGEGEGEGDGDGEGQGEGEEEKDDAPAGNDAADADEAAPSKPASPLKDGAGGEANGHADEPAPASPSPLKDAADEADEPDQGEAQDQAPSQEHVAAGGDDVEMKSDDSGELTPAE